MYTFCNILIFIKLDTNPNPNKKIKLNEKEKKEKCTGQEVIEVNQFKAVYSAVQRLFC